MDQSTKLSSQVSNPQVAAEKTSRVRFADHLRAALVILVVLHHAALVYGAAAPFYYVEPPFTEPLAYVVLLAFALMNQGWFMGALYLIAGYFTQGSFERKGAGSFLKGRLVRLGTPLLVFYFTLSPLSSIGYWQMPAEMTGITDPLSIFAYPYLLGLGPMWFVALLLIFGFGYALWRRLTRNRPTPAAGDYSPPGCIGVIIFTLALALVTYLLRFVIPLGREILDFPTLGYLPQYLSFFIIGIVAYRRDWFRKTTGSMGVAGFVTVLVATIFLFPLALSGQLFSLELSDPAPFVGNGSWQSAVYALWDSTFAVGMTLAALTFFRRYFNGASSLGRFLSEQSYAVYLIHIPIVVFIAIALQRVELPALLMFVLLSVIALQVSFAIAYILRRIPGVSRVL